jgi:hypothetical protein
MLNNLLSIMAMHTRQSTPIHIHATVSQVHSSQNPVTEKLPREGDNLGGSRTFPNIVKNPQLNIIEQSSLRKD